MMAASVNIGFGAAGGVAGGGVAECFTLFWETTRVFWAPVEVVERLRLDSPWTGTEWLIGWLSQSGTWTPVRFAGIVLAVRVLVQWLCSPQTLAPWYARWCVVATGLIGASTVGSLGVLAYARLFETPTTMAMALGPAHPIITVSWWVDYASLLFLAWYARGIERAWGSTASRVPLPIFYCIHSLIATDSAAFTGTTLSSESSESSESLESPPGVKRSPPPPPPRSMRSPSRATASYLLVCVLAACTVWWGVVVWRCNIQSAVVRGTTHTLFGVNQLWEWTPYLTLVGIPIQTLWLTVAAAVITSPTGAGAGSSRMYSAVVSFLLLVVAFYNMTCAVTAFAYVRMRTGRVLLGGDDDDDGGGPRAGHAPTVALKQS